ncbi:MAG: lytic murein transglycosylase B [Gammaproteobacteria bacterium]|nr:lytic murein transglycosylase B [Gammaproteobacteria bacterium]
MLFSVLAFSFSVSLAATKTTSQFEQKQIDQFIDEMVKEHQFDPIKLRGIFAKAEKKQTILDAISRPAEGKPWHEYRPIFMTESRIREGIKFIKKNRQILEAAEKKYGVPASIITAIIGVETRYGRFRGNYRVLDALSTLSFAYPKRAKFFRGQLKEFLIMAREEEMDPLKPLGSYAGAMGQPQFIPSSFRSYAIDFDGDGRRDLWDNMDDIIGSVANYFSRHNWRAGEAIITRAKVSGTAPESLLKGGYKPSFKAEKLHAHKIGGAESIPADREVALIALEHKQGHEYWIGFHNFYVITRYNHSPLYAMAVYQLSEAIRSGAAL